MSNSKKTTKIPPFEMGYCKPPAINLEQLKLNYQTTNSIDNENTYNPFSVKKIQRYQPIFTLFFDMNENNFHVQF